MAASLLSACGGSGDGNASAGTPALQSFTGDRSLEVDKTITPIVFVNRGGSLTSCALKAGETLPTGLVLAPSANSSTCAITGTPSVKQTARLYTVIANSNSGISMATVSIAIVDKLLAGCADGSASGQRTARYRVVFRSDWSTANNGGILPANAGFSVLYGASHNQNFTLWAPGNIVSTAFEALVENSMTDNLRIELLSARENNRIGEIIEGGRLPMAAGSTNITFEIRCEFPLVSLVARLEPSPDWFVGVNSFPLVDSGNEWIAMSEPRDLLVYDAGTEIGDRFLTTGANTMPKQAVSLLVGNQAIGFTRGRERIGQIVFQRIDTQ